MTDGYERRGQMSCLIRGSNNSMRVDLICKISVYDGTNSCEEVMWKPRWQCRQRIKIADRLSGQFVIKYREIVLKLFNRSRSDNRDDGHAVWTLTQP